MRVLLATGIFFPEVGGPAIHVKKIAEHFSSHGIKVAVICYGEKNDAPPEKYKVVRISRKYPKPIQWLVYFLRAFLLGWGSDIVYAFDPTAAGLPSALVTKILRKPFLIRIGGDPIWERLAEFGVRLMPLEEYYEKELYIQDKPYLYKAIKFVMNSATEIIFYNDFWVHFFSKFYGIDQTKMRIVKNPVFKRETSGPGIPKNPTIIFAGRFVKYKNLLRVINVFDQVNQRDNSVRLLLIGSGPEKEDLVRFASTKKSKNAITFAGSLPQEKLFEKIRESAVAIGPALSEFNPNFILESLSLGKPVLLSRGNGLSVKLPEEFIFDPQDENELKTKLEFILSPSGYERAIELVNNLDMSQTWDKVLAFHLELVQKYSR